MTAIQFPPSIVIYDYKICYENQKLLNGSCKHANDVRQPNNGVFSGKLNASKKTFDYLFYFHVLRFSSCIENDFYAIKGNLAMRYTTVKLVKIQKTGRKTEDKRYVLQTTQDAFRRYCWLHSSSFEFQLPRSTNTVNLIESQETTKGFQLYLYPAYENVVLMW
ncbi:hypothetical protein T11_10390 [Trichinella zimbabwensis]|uniref:Uncharacterized protein n=1 Tax=Trichinella zimbabwensis TaxID=268475 RepID=A0A0V1H734_9BILA|nr:hypothetical protein T11_10390 [Trichinella zimbabwensis]